MQSRGTVRRTSVASVPNNIAADLAARRRFSIDANQTREFLIDVDTTWLQVLQQEDTDGDCKITVMDKGPKVISLGTLRSGGARKHDVRGTYGLSILLQELSLAREMGLKHIILDENTLNENPVDRLSRLIRDCFWDSLTRTIDAEGIARASFDTKNHRADKTPRVYVPAGDEEAFEYYSRIASERREPLQVIRLPPVITADYVKTLDNFPGILTLKLRHGPNGLQGVPFVVPGGRFNEMYGWDSYFEVLGLLVDGRLSLAQGMVDNFVYEIQHYGKVLNANRSYYLTRTQPPFLTDMARRVFDALPPSDARHEWMATALHAAVKEYRTVWMSPPRYVAATGLSRYHDEGFGMPPETESTHFNAVMSPYARKHKMDIEHFKVAYAAGEISEPSLDEYFIHDRAVRESGHDTTYRLEGRCAHLNVVDLNSLLYKYEIDIGTVIRDEFGDQLTMPDGTVESSAPWFAAAARRAELIDKYCWNDEDSLYYDYDVVEKRQSSYQSVTSIFALWAGHVSPDKAERLIETIQDLFEEPGGLTCGTLESRGDIHLERPNRQWDYPYGWAPHQILAWSGMHRYGRPDIAERLAYRWLYMVTKSFVDYNGTVPEKFDVVNRSHHIFAEYGNVGTDFSYVSREGFGWMNASYQVGLCYLSRGSIKALGALIAPEQVYDSRGRARSLSSGAIENMSQLTSDAREPEAMGRGD